MTHTRKSLLQIIAAYERETTKWHERGKRIVKRYRDERSDSETMQRRYNVLWSNVETLKPFLYSSTPKPIVSQRGDTEDPIARIAAQVLERALVFTVAENHFGSCLRHSRDDYLLPGRGTAWARYVPEYKPAAPQVTESTTDEDAGVGDTTEVVAFESAVADYVHWKDFGHDLAPTWEAVDIVWRRVGMNREALDKRFTEGAKVPLDAKPGETGKSVEDSAEKGIVYELWIKSEKRAVWLSKSYDKLLDDRDDPLKLDHFFPCPEPVYATTTTDSLIPIPDYVEYQDQADELDDLTGRIAALTKAIKAVGVYDSSVDALKKILDDGNDNTLIPVTNWATLTEKGGLSGAVELLPMKEIAETLLSLYEAREKVKADLYEVSGMSDIVRGNTAPEETATAQKIKSNFATKRLDERQREVERFARNIVDILGNIIAVHFDPQTLVKMTGIKLFPQAVKQMAQQAQTLSQQLQPPPPQPGQPAQMPDAMIAQQFATVSAQLKQFVAQSGMSSEQVQDALSKPTWEEVIALLRDQPRRRFAIDIETDSIVAADDAESQGEATQFVEGLTGLLEKAGELGGADPEAIPLMGEVIKFAVSKYRVGRDLADAIDEYIEKKEKQAQQPQSPKPDPAMAKVESAHALGQQKIEQNGQAKQAELAQDAQQHQTELAQQGQVEALKAHFQQQTDAMNARFDAAQNHQQAMLESMTERFKAMLQARTQIEVAEIGAGATVDAAQISGAQQATDGE